MKPGPGVWVPTYADNFFHFLIFQCSYIHKLCPGGSLPTFSMPVFLLPSFQSILLSRGLFCKYCCLRNTRNKNQSQNLLSSLPKGFPRQMAILISLKFYDLRDQSNGSGMENAESAICWIKTAAGNPQILWQGVWWWQQLVWEQPRKTSRSIGIQTLHQ